MICYDMLGTLNWLLCVFIALQCFAPGLFLSGTEVCCLDSKIGSKMV